MHLKYIVGLISLWAICIQAAGKPEVLIAREVPSLDSASVRPLKELAARRLANMFDPGNGECDIADLKTIVGRSRFAGQTARDVLAAVLCKEKAAVLESINDAQPVELSDARIHGDLVVSPDSSYLCYRLFRERTLVCIHLPTQQKTSFYSPHLAYNLGGFGERCAQYIFGADSTSVYFNSVQPGAGTAVYRYHIPTQDVSIHTHVPISNMRYWTITPEGKRIICKHFDADKKSYISVHDVDKSTDVQLRGESLGVGLDMNMAGTRMVLNDPGEQHVSCCDNNGTVLLRHAYQDRCKYATINPEGTRMATVINNEAHLWDIDQQKLLRSIIYEYHAIDYLEMSDDAHLLITVPDKESIFYVDVYLTQLKTGRYKLLAKKIRRLEVERNCWNGDRQLRCFSRDRQLLVGKEHTQALPRLWLYDCGTQQPLKDFTPYEPDGLQILPDDSAVIFTRNCTPWIYRTHRAITNEARVVDMLGLMLLARQKLAGRSSDAEIVAQLTQSPAARVKAIVAERYTT